MARIFGKDGYKQLMLGYPVNINDMETRAFQVGEGGCRPGDLLVYTTATQVYKQPAVTTDKLAGICLATNVHLDKVFPQSVEEGYDVGYTGTSCIVRGAVAVKLKGTAPAEGAPVYWDLTDKAFTATATGALACANMEFAGITEGNLTVVRVRY